MLPPVNLEMLDKVWQTCIYVDSWLCKKERKTHAPGMNCWPVKYTSWHFGRRCEVGPVTKGLDERKVPTVQGGEQEQDSPHFCKAGNLEGWIIVAKRKEPANQERKVTMKLIYLGLEFECGEEKLMLLKIQNHRLMIFLYLGFRLTLTSWSGTT